MEDEKTQEPTCKSCGNTGWKPTTRREFLHGTVAAGIGLAVGTAMLTAPIDAEALPAQLCSELLKSCIDACNSAPMSRWERFQCKNGCGIDYVACIAQSAADAINDAIDQAGQWIHDNAGLIIVGTVVVIIGITFIVATGGSAAGGLVLVLA
mgnify:CR=1 FL=1